MAEHPGGLGAFRHRIFRTLWISSVTSNTGGMIQTVGAAWAMTQLTTSQSMVALVQASITLPMMLFAFLAGVLADSQDRRRMMLVSQVFMLVVSLALAMMAFMGLLTPWSLLVFTFLIGCGTALHNPSWQASFSDIVPREDLPSAVSMNAMGMNVTRSIGPAVGGAIVAAFGAGAAFAVNAASYVALIGALLFWKPEKRTSRLPPERFTGAAAAGLRYMMLSPDLLSANFRGFLYGFAGIAMQALLPLVARDTLGGTAMTYGILLAAFGVGAVIGALYASRLRLRFHNELIARLGFGLFAVMNIVIAHSGSLWLSVPFILIAGACWINVMALINVTVQMSTPRWVLGRMISLNMTWIFGGMALGSWVWGAVAQSYGIAAAFYVSAAALVAGMLWGYRFPLMDYGALNLDPLDRFNEPALKLDLNRRSGPIMIMVEYEIAQENVTEFLAAMRDRRRIRIRDGGQRWALLRDLENPDRWIESYHLPTWTDYLRHIARRTVADQEVIRRLQALNREGRPIRVHRMIERGTVVPKDDTPRIITKPESPH